MPPSTFKLPNLNFHMVFRLIDGNLRCQTCSLLPHFESLLINTNGSQKPISENVCWHEDSKCSNYLIKQYFWAIRHQNICTSLPLSAIQLQPPETPSLFFLLPCFLIRDTKLNLFGYHVQKCLSCVTRCNRCISTSSLLSCNKEILLQGQFSDCHEITESFFFSSYSQSYIYK